MKITNHFKSQLQAYFIKRLGAFKYRNGWLRVPVCPYCGRDNKMGVNLNTYRCNCFRCGEHPSPAQMVMDVEHLDTYSELIKYLQNETFQEIPFKEEEVELAEAKQVYLPEGFINIAFGNNSVGNGIRNYIQKRGFSISDLSKKGIGYCSTGKLFGYLIIPFYSSGTLKYYNARNVIGRGPRYNNPTKDITGLGKEFIIFNEDALYMYNSIYICEGAINAMTMGDRAIATMGKSISRYQINKLIKSPVQRYIILLDPDAKSKAIELAIKLQPFKRVKVVILPDNKDVNDLGRSSTLRYVYATRYQSYSQLLNMKL